MIPLEKYHALGNDYLVAVESELPLELTPALVRAICDRHRGIGSDGILAAQIDGSTRRLTIWNPDGSRAEKSGNGLRIFSRFLFDRGLVGAEPFEVELASDTVECRVQDDGRSIRVGMGRVRFDSAAIPVRGPRREVLNEPIEVDGAPLRFSAATIGNPHCVVLREHVDSSDARRFGPLLEAHPLFPNRSNVQFVQVLDRSTLRLEIWERGAGYTLASGSSSCAAVAVAHRLGLVDGSVRALMPGGALDIEISPGFDVRMTGPATRVARVELTEEALRGD